MVSAIIVIVMAELLGILSDGVRSSHRLHTKSMLMVAIVKLEIYIFFILSLLFLDYMLNKISDNGIFPILFFILYKLYN